MTSVGEAQRSTRRRLDLLDPLLADVQRLQLVHDGKADYARAWAGHRLRLAF